MQITNDLHHVLTGTDTDFSESEALSSLQISGPAKGASLVSPPSQSEQEDTTAGKLFYFCEIKLSEKRDRNHFLRPIWLFCRTSRPKNRN